MPLIDRTQLNRQMAIVDMLMEMPAPIAWHAISVLSLEAQNSLYDWLHDIETRRGLRCGSCRKPLDQDHDGDELCGTCGDRSEQINDMREMMSKSGVVFGEKL